MFILGAKELAKLNKQYPTSRHFNSFAIFAPNDWTMITGGIRGSVDKIEYNGENSYKVGNKTQPVTWLSDDLIAVQEHIDYSAPRWMIMEHLTDGTTPLTHITKQFLSKTR